MPASPKLEPPPIGIEMAVIALGGAIGSGLRFSISLLIAAAGLPGVLAAGSVNVVGSFLLGLVLGHLESESPHRLLRPFLAVGVLGSFTTFSALALDNRTLAAEAGEAVAAGYVAASLLLGLCAFAIGQSIRPSAAASAEGGPDE